MSEKASKYCVVKISDSVKVNIRKRIFIIGTFVDLKDANKFAITMIKKAEKVNKATKYIVKKIKKP